MAENIKIDKEKLTQEQSNRLGQVFNTIFTALSSYDWNFTPAETEKMLVDIDIKGNIDQIKRSVNSKILSIKGDDGKFKDSLIEQFDNINLNNTIDVIIDSKFKGYSVQEIIYNDDLTMNKLKEKPNNWYYQCWNDELERYEWVLTYGNGGISGVNADSQLPLGKYLIPMNRPTDIQINGRSELEPLYKFWKIKNNALDYANEIVEKYGGIITWFVYNQDTSNGDLDNMVEGIKAIASGSVMAIPKNPGEMQGLNHDFGFISLENLTNDMHMDTVDKCEKKISQYLLGSSITYTAGESGSYSSGEVGKELLDSVVDSYTKYVEEWIEYLVYYQSLIFGFNYKDYIVSLDEKPNLNGIQELNNKKIENYKGIKDLGYQVSIEYISKETGIPIEELSILEMQPLIEFEKKKTLNDIKSRDIQIDEDLQKVTQKKISLISAQIAKQYKEKYSKIKSKSDIDKITTDFSKTDFDEFMIRYNLFGIYTQIYSDEIEFEEVKYTTEELFDLPFDEAIKFFADKIPRLYDDIEEITGEAIAKTFWVKKITDIEVSKKMKVALDKILAEGGTFKDFVGDIPDVLKKSGISKDGYYLQNVFRTNMLSSYNAGRYEQQQLTKDVFEYLLYNTIDDSRRSKVCTDLADKVYRSDNLIWNRIYPPNHYACRSIATALTDEQVKELGLEVSNGTEGATDALKAIEKTDFDNNPANQKQKLKQIATDKETEYNKE